MNVLQPWVLAALPLVALPILIHLINQRRYQTLRWGAMMFLLAANRMSRGYARLRQWLILAFRTLAVFGLIFAVSRPLASGWLGLAAGGRADTTIVLLDRSPSMQQRAATANRSKLDAGVQQLVASLNVIPSAHWVLIDSQDPTPRTIDSPDRIAEVPGPTGSSAAADLPAMLEAARNYIRANKTGRTEIWICSDLRSNDWAPDSGRWAALRAAFLEFPQTLRFHLLAYADRPDDNIAVRVVDARRENTPTGGELVLSVLLTREGGRDDTRVSLPLRIEIEGARSEVTVDFAGPRYELKDHRIPLDRSQQRGWGSLSIPADSNPADNDAYFVFDEPPVRHTLVVAEDPAAVRPLQLAASIAPTSAIPCAAELLAPEQLAAVDWSRIALVLWQSALPTGETAQALESFVKRGGYVVFFPPRSPTEDAFLGARWENWRNADAAVAVESWRGDEDLVAHAQSGAALPVGQLDVRRSCGLKGEVTPLATLSGGAPLLARVATARGGVYFCATTAAAPDSSLATDGIVLYAMVQRAAAGGAAVLGNTRNVEAGHVGEELTPAFRVVAGGAQAVSTEYAYHRGVYANNERYLAINRPVAEDHATILNDGQVSSLFEGLDLARVDDQADNYSSLVQEIWRLFLLIMLIALLVEAALCLPKLTRPAAARAGARS